MVEDGTNPSGQRRRDLRRLLETRNSRCAGVCVRESDTSLLEISYLPDLKRTTDLSSSQAAEITVFVAPPLAGEDLAPGWPTLGQIAELKDLRLNLITLFRLSIVLPPSPPSSVPTTPSPPRPRVDLCTSLPASLLPLRSTSQHGVHGAVHIGRCQDGALIALKYSVSAHLEAEESIYRQLSQVSPPATPRCFGLFAGDLGRGDGHVLVLEYGGSALESFGLLSVDQW